MHSVSREWLKRMRNPLFARLRARLDGIELVVFLGALVLVAGVWGFLTLAENVMEGDAQRLDEHILRALRTLDDPRVPIGPPWLLDVARDVSALGGTAVLALVTAAVTSFLLLDGKRGAAVFVLSATVTGAVLSHFLKAYFQRPRPTVVPHLANARFSSFPSGHSLMSAVVYLTLGLLLARLVARQRLKLHVLGVALLLTVLVGLSRVFLGVHYPTDVLAGWCAGLVWASLCWLIERRLQIRAAIESEL